MAPQVSTAAVPKIGPDLSRFVAARQQTEFGGYLWDQEVPHPSKILRDHSEPGQRVGELYGVMLDTDCTLAGLWEKRWKAVVGLPWEIVPGANTPEAQRIARLVAFAIDQIKSLDVNLTHQLEGILQGCAFDELRYEYHRAGRLAGLWTPVEVVDRPMWRFGFKERESGRCELHVRTKGGGLVPVQPARFLALRHGTKDNPWGAPLLDRVFWFYWLSLHVWKYAGVALEKWAQPTPVGRYPRTENVTLNEKAVEDLLAAIADMQTEYGLAIPDDLKIELLEAQRAGSVSYESFIQLLDRAKALIILGEVDTSGLAKGPGSFAKSRVSNDVRLETIRMDAGELADHLTDQLIRPMVRLNWGSAAPVPYWEFDVVDAEDREVRQKGMQAVLNRGLPAPRDDYYRLHQVRQPRPGEEVIQDDLVIGTSGFASDEEAGKPGPKPPAPAAWADQEIVH